MMKSGMVWSLQMTQRAPIEQDSLMPLRQNASENIVTFPLARFIGIIGMGYFDCSFD